MTTSFQGGMAEKQQCRVVLLLDLDCFYAQVEQKRCGIPRDVPCAVQQWEGLIAVNYAARAKGVTRHMRAPEARVKCPEIQLVHVQTLGSEDNVTEDAQSLPGGDPQTNNGHSRLTHKACLERYREASAQIMAIIRKLTPGAIVERASIDEMYIDVTSMVEEELRQQAPGGDDGASPAATLAFGWGGIVIDGPLRVDSEFERRLSVGAMIALRLRNAIHEKLGYTASAGIACNKLLAKVAAGLHKPNQQTIVPPRAAEALLADMPLGKIRNFGGKLGAELQSMGCSTPGQVRKVPLHVLEERFGERAPWILSAMRGISDDPVVEKELPKSMLAAKSFAATSDWRAIQRWLGILAEELAGRMMADATANHRHPRNLVLHYRASGSGTTTAAGRTKTCPMPYFGRQKPNADTIAAAALKLAQSCSDFLPCFQLAISATEFAAAPVAKHKSIERFFGAAKPSQTASLEANAAYSNGSGAAQQGSASQDAAQSTGKGRRSQQPHNGIVLMFSRAAAAIEQPTNHGHDRSGGGDRPGHPQQQTLQRASPFETASSTAAAAATAAATSSAGSRMFRFQPEPPDPASLTGAGEKARTSAMPGSPFQQPLQSLSDLQPLARSGSSSRSSSGSSGMARSSGGRRSPTAAAIAARRDAFAAAADAAIAAVSGSLRSDSSEQESGEAVGSAPKSAETAAEQAATAAAEQAATAEAAAAAARPAAEPNSVSAVTHQVAPRRQQEGAAQPADQAQAAAFVQLPTAPASSTEAAGIGASPPADAAHGRPAAEDAVLLDNVDLLEQRRILREIEVRQAMEARGRRDTGGRKGGGSHHSKKRVSAGSSGGVKRGKGVPAGGQTQLSGYFAKQSSAE